MRIWKSFHQLPLLTLQAHIPQGFYSESKVRLLAPSFSLQIKIGKELAINSWIVTLFWGYLRFMRALERNITKINIVDCMLGLSQTNGQISKKKGTNNLVCSINNCLPEESYMSLKPLLWMVPARGSVMSDELSSMARVWGGQPVAPTLHAR